MSGALAYAKDRDCAVELGVGRAVDIELVFGGLSVEETAVVLRSPSKCNARLEAG